MTIFGFGKMVPVNPNHVEEQQQHSKVEVSSNSREQAGDAVKSEVATEQSSTANTQIQPGLLDSKPQLPQSLLSSFVRLTENDEDFQADKTHGKELVPSNTALSMMLEHDQNHEDALNGEEDDGWNLDGSGDSGHGLLASAGGLSAGALSPFTSRAHAAAAFGRLAKRAITFGDLIAAVDCFTAAYGQLEQTEQRIVIARMYFLNRQLLYCQHDIIRQKQALAVAALAEAQAKMLEMTNMDMAGESFESLANQLMSSPSGQVDNGGNSNYIRSSNSANAILNAYPASYRSMMMGHGTQQQQQVMVNTPLAYGNNTTSNSMRLNHPVNDSSTKMASNLSMMTPSPVLKPGVPLVTIQTGNNHHPSKPMQPPSSMMNPLSVSSNNQLPQQPYHHPHHAQHQPSQHQHQQQQPVRLDAKHLLLLQYLHNNNNANINNNGVSGMNGMGTQTSPSPASYGFGTQTGGSTRGVGMESHNGGIKNQQNIDVGIQVSMPNETFGRAKVDQQQKGGARRQQQQRGRRNVVSWWPGVGDVDAIGDEVMLPQPQVSMANLVMQQQQQQQQQSQQQRRQMNNRRMNNKGSMAVNNGNTCNTNFGGEFSGPSFGRFVPSSVNEFRPSGFFDDEVVKQTPVPNNVYNRSMQQMPTPSQQQQQALKQIYENSNLIEQLLMAGNLGGKVHSSLSSMVKCGGQMPVGNSAAFAGQQQDMISPSGMCSCPHQHQQPQQPQPQPRQVPTAPPSSSSSTMSQQAAMMLSNRPLRRFDNCDIFEGDALSSSSQQQQSSLA